MKKQKSYSYDKKRNMYFWEMRWSDASGKQYCKTFRAKTEKKLKAKVEDYFKKYEEEIKELENKGCTLQQWFERWLDSIKESAGPNTFLYYEYLGRSYIIPELGNRLLSDINAIEIRTLLRNVKENEKLNENMIKDVGAVLGLALDAAWSEAVSNVHNVKVTKLMCDRKKEVVAFTHEEIQRLLDIAKHKDYLNAKGVQKCKETEEQEYLRGFTYYFVRVAVETGMHASEVFALNWNDIDFANSTINVNKAVYESGAKIKNKVCIRSISVATSVIDELKQWKKTQEEYASHHTDSFIGQNLVFADVNGNYRSMRHFEFYYWNKLCGAAGLEGYGIQSIRHYHAIDLIWRHIEIDSISRRLGHLNTYDTCKIYGNEIKKMLEVLSDGLEFIEF